MRGRNRDRIKTGAVKKYQVWVLEMEQGSSVGSLSTQEIQFGEEEKTEDDVCSAFANLVQPMFRKQTSAYSSQNSVDSKLDEPRCENKILRLLIVQQRKNLTCRIEDRKDP